MSRAKRVVNLPPAEVMANLHRILGQPPYRLVEAGKDSFRFRVGDYEGGRLHPPMEGIIRVFGQGSLSEIDYDIQTMGHSALALTVLAIVFAWTIVVPLFVYWWIKRAPRRAIDRILSSF